MWMQPDWPPLPATNSALGIRGAILPRIVAAA